MATGYTTDIHDGKEVSFTDFILKCTRAMGVAIMQRDQDLSVPLVDEEVPSDYHQKALSKAIITAAELKRLSLDEWEQRERDDREAATTHVRDAIKKAGEIRVRYESMLAEVEAWRPPTPEHQGLKDFMTEQLTSSIKFDCNVSYLTMPPTRTAEEFRDERIAKAERDIEYHREGWAKDQERAASRNRWVRDLRDSLNAITATA